MTPEYQFGERLAMSNGVSAGASVADILRDNVPGALSVTKASRDEDRSGVDWWVVLCNGDRLGVDCKVREEDWSLRGCDDLALETWSVVERRIAGWTRRADKRTDYVLWLWKDTGRWCLVPFPMLCKVFGEHWIEWGKTYRTWQQFTPDHGGGYHSECVFVPRREVWNAIYRKFGGQPPAAA